MTAQYTPESPREILLQRDLRASSNKPPTAPCPALWLLEAVRAEVCTAQEQSEVESHLHQCPQCDGYWQTLLSPEEASHVPPLEETLLKGRNYAQQVPEWRQRPDTRPYAPKAASTTANDVVDDGTLATAADTASLNEATTPDNAPATIAIMPHIDEPETAHMTNPSSFNIWTQAFVGVFGLAAIMMLVWIPADWQRKLDPAFPPVTRHPMRTIPAPIHRRSLPRKSPKVPAITPPQLHPKGSTHDPGSAVQARLRLFLKRHEQYIKEAPEMVFQVGDQLRFGYWLEAHKKAYVWIFSVDEKREFNLLYPASAGATHSIRPGRFAQRRLLPGGLLMDKTSRTTRLFACLSWKPIPSTKLQSAAALSADKTGQTAALALPCFYQKSWRLQRAKQP